MEEWTTLKQEFDRIANSYAESLKETYFTDDFDSYWVADEPGGVLEIGDFFLGFDDIRHIVDNQVPIDTWASWYWYCTELGMLDRTIETPSLKSWCAGCPRIPEDSIEDVRRLAAKIEEMKSRLHDEIEKLKREAR